MQISWKVHRLRMRHRWAVSTNAASGGRDEIPTLVVCLEDGLGRVGWGEAPTARRYGEVPETIEAFLATVKVSAWSFGEPEAGLAEIRRWGPGHRSARCALESALLDGASAWRGCTLRGYLGLGDRGIGALTSMSLGLDRPEVMRLKAVEALAGGFRVLKLKVGGSTDEAGLRAVREVADGVPVRVDANEAWATAEEALDRIQRLADWGPIEFVEQPMPAGVGPGAEEWLRARSPVPLVADESCQGLVDLAACRVGFHGVNVKLVKTSGVLGACEVLKAARGSGMRTLLGCMVETSLGITAAAQLSGLADDLDLDGALLTSNDPFDGVRFPGGGLSFASLGSRLGLQAQPVS